MNEISCDRPNKTLTDHQQYMVFQSTHPPPHPQTKPNSSSSSPPSSSSMATAPVKSQPLHNFSLPFLKWGNNHRHRKPHDRDSQSPSPSPSRLHQHHRSSASESDDQDSILKLHHKKSKTKNNKNPLRHPPPPVGSRTATSSKNRREDGPPQAEAEADEEEEEEETPPPPTSETPLEEVRSNLLIRFRKDDSFTKHNSNKTAVVALAATTAPDVERVEVDESAQKPWNLRPRKSSSSVFKVPSEIGGTQKNLEVVDDKHQENLPKSLRLRGFVESQNVEKKEKTKFSIALSRDDIEEDYFVLTGSKLPRRPKKRPRNIQKQLDNCFPGMWLAGVTPECYEVPDVPTKR